MPNTTTFAQRLRTLRKKKGLQLNDVADAISASRSAVGTWETGVEPGASEIRRLAEFFAVSADYIVGISETEQPLVPGHFIVDLDTYDALKAKRRVGKGQRWYAVVPDRFDIVTPRAYAALADQLPLKDR